MRATTLRVLVRWRGVAPASLSLTLSLTHALAQTFFLSLPNSGVVRDAAMGSDAQSTVRLRDSRSWDRGAADLSGSSLFL